MPIPLGVKPQALGGSVGAGDTLLVGERGPELFVPRSAGTVVPNSRIDGGGSTYAPTYNIDARGSDIGVEQKIRAALEDYDRNAAPQRIQNTVNLLNKYPG
jgi:phage-related minor tail protein